MNKKGFTFVELMVVVFIIIVLAIAAAIGVERAVFNAKVVKTKADLRQIALAIKQLYIDTRQWPDRYKHDQNALPEKACMPSGGCTPSCTGDNCTDDPNVCTGGEVCTSVGSIGVTPGCTLPVANYRTPFQVCWQTPGWPTYECTDDGIGNLTGAYNDYENNDGSDGPKHDAPGFTSAYSTEAWTPSYWGGLTGNPGTGGCYETFTQCTSDGECHGGPTDKCMKKNNWYMTQQDPYPNWKGPYISHPMYDGWGFPYFEECWYIIAKGVCTNNTTKLCDYNSDCPNSSCGGKETYGFVIGSPGPDGKKSTRSDNIILDLSKIIEY